MLPPASVADLAAWHKASQKRDAMGAQYAPPVYIAYGGAKIMPASGSTYQFTVLYNYDSDENLLSVQDADTGFIYWENEGMDAFGHVTDEDYGNGVTTISTYDAATGLVNSVQSGTTTPKNFQNLTYQWDGYGNLYTRQDGNLGLTETFGYDSLNRLGTSTVSGGSNNVAPITITYDNLGNIKTKSAVGTYDYTGYVHRLNTITLGTQVTNYQYDNDGNISCSGGTGTNCSGAPNIRTVTWTPGNQPGQITYNGNSMTFAYDPEGQRYQEYSLASGAISGTTTLEIGDYAEVVTPDGGSPTYRMMIKAGSATVAIHTIQPGGNYTDDYLGYDHLGSVDTITNDNGLLETSGKMSFDVFGQRRCSSDWTATSCDGGQLGTTDRGYTNQQQLDGIGLVHMEGRVYDPMVGRFMSADPNIQDRYNSQCLNRYAYVDNNPLNSTDPTGFDSTNVYEGANGQLSFISNGGLPIASIDDEGNITPGPGNGAGNNSYALVSGSNPTNNTSSPLFGQDQSTTDDGDAATSYGSGDEGFGKEPVTAPIYGAGGSKIGLYPQYASDPIDQLFFSEAMDANAKSRHKEGSEYASYLYEDSGKIADTSLFSGTQNRVTSAALKEHADLLFKSNPGAVIVAAFHNHGTDYDCPGCYEGFSGWKEYQQNGPNGAYTLDLDVLARHNAADQPAPFGPG